MVNASLDVQGETLAGMPLICLPSGQPGPDGDQDTGAPGLWRQVHEAGQKHSKSRWLGQRETETVGTGGPLGRVEVKTEGKKKPVEEMNPVPSSSLVPKP